jgi:Ca-activated chloride channel family protein
MVDFGSTTTITCCAVLGGALAAFAETLHAKRVRLSAPLAFGPSFEPANCTQALPALRAILIAGAIWGLMTLISLDGSREQSKAEGERHLFVLLDVSPSMLIEDAGPERNQRRALRAAESDVHLSDFRRRLLALFQRACWRRAPSVTPTLTKPTQ